MSKIACLECGAVLDRLAVHLKTHSLTTGAYTERHPGAPTSSPEVLARIAAQTKRAMGRADVRERSRAGYARRDQTGERNPFFGKVHSEATRRVMAEKAATRDLSAGFRAYLESRRGKTVEEIHGAEIGATLRRKFSIQRSGARNPAYGKLYEGAGGRGIAGWYKEHLFRSTYEYSFYKYLERMGVDLSRVRYEPFSLRYTLGGEVRHYRPDFLVDDLLVVEVKSRWHLERAENSAMNAAKLAACQAHCDAHDLRFAVLTEDDFPIVPYGVLAADPDVQLRARFEAA